MDGRMDAASVKTVVLSSCGYVLTLYRDLFTQDPGSSEEAMGDQKISENLRIVLVGLRIPTTRMGRTCANV